MIRQVIPNPIYGVFGFWEYRVRFDNKLKEQSKVQLSVTRLSGKIDSVSFSWEHFLVRTFRLVGRDCKVDKVAPHSISQPDFFTSSKLTKMHWIQQTIRPGNWWCSATFNHRKTFTNEGLWLMILSSFFLASMIVFNWKVSALFQDEITKVTVTRKFSPGHKQGCIETRSLWEAQTGWRKVFSLSSIMKRMQSAGSVCCVP